jgi:hypothetical protein
VQKSRHSPLATWPMQLCIKALKVQSTYFTVRGQSYFSRLPKYWPPIPLSAWQVRARICKPFKQPRNRFSAGGPVRESYLSYRHGRLHRLAESISRYWFLGSINVYKYGLWLPPQQRRYSTHSPGGEGDGGVNILEDERNRIALLQ